MARRKLDVEVPDGQHLGFSRDTAGAYRAHLFDDQTNDLVGHAELFEPNEDDEDPPHIQYIYVPDSGATEHRELTAEELAAAVVALVRLGIIVATLAARAAPRVRRWWHRAIPPIKSTSDSAFLTMKSTWNRFSGSSKRGAAPAVTIPGNVPVRAESSTELVVAFQDYRNRMSSAEARKRFVAAVMARAFSEEQLKMLHNVKIGDENDPATLRAAMEALTPQQVGETITSLLEKNQSLLDRASLAELGSIVGEIRPDGEHVPLTVERVNALPRVTGGQVGSW
ncbi:hypothetical protein ACX80W_11075 [Arthrobacter sp. TMN-37]